MFNPYFQDPVQMLSEQKDHRAGENPMEGILKRIKGLDSDDLLLLLLIVILIRDGCREEVWPLLTALVYCMI